MKEYKKLAEEFAERRCSTLKFASEREVVTYKIFVEMGFIEGFFKARDLMLEKELSRFNIVSLGEKDVE